MKIELDQNTLQRRGHGACLMLGCVLRDEEGNTEIEIIKVFGILGD